MYLIREIWETMKTQPKIIKGLRIRLLEKSGATVSERYWGKTDIHFEKEVDFSKISRANDIEHLLTYVSDYEVNDLEDSFKEILLHVGSYQPENQEGYIIFCGNIFGVIKTNGKKIIEDKSLFTSVIVLKDGEYLEFEGSKFKVIDKQLVMFI